MVATFAAGERIRRKKKGGVTPDPHRAEKKGLAATGHFSALEGRGEGAERGRINTEEVTDDGGRSKKIGERRMGPLPQGPPTGGPDGSTRPPGNGRAQSTSQAQEGKTIKRKSVRNVTVQRVRHEKTTAKSREKRGNLQKKKWPKTWIILHGLETGILTRLKSRDTQTPLRGQGGRCRKKKRYATLETRVTSSNYRGGKKEWVVQGREHHFPPA